MTLFTQKVYRNASEMSGNFTSQQPDKQQLNTTPKMKLDACANGLSDGITHIKGHKRTVVLDEDHFEKTFLKCMVCQELFDRVNRVPKALPCQHSVCILCLREMFRVESEFRINMTSAFRVTGPSAVKLTCPACRESAIKSAEDINNLPSDVTILELVDFIQESDRCVVLFCPSHKDAAMNFYCVDCKQQICSVCAAGKNHLEHTIIPSDTAIRESEPEVMDTLQLVVSECSYVSQIKHSVETTLNNLCIVSREIAHDVASAFNTTVQQQKNGKSRIDELLDITQEEILRKRKSLTEHLNLLYKREAELKVSKSFLEEAYTNGDLDLMFTLHNLVKDTLAQPLPSFNNEKNELTAKLSFTSEEEVESYEEIRDLAGNLISCTR